MADEREDGWELRPNGGAYLTVDGRSIRLRPARLGDYRTMVDAFFETSYSTLSALRAEADWIAAEAATEPEEDWSEEKRQGIADRRRKRADEASVEWFKWARLLIVTLAPGEEGLPANDDDVPLWLGANTLAMALMDHWRTTPTPSGAR